MKFCPGGIDKGIHVARVIYSTALNVDEWGGSVFYVCRVRYADSNSLLSLRLSADAMRRIIKPASVL